MGFNLLKKDKASKATETVSLEKETSQENEVQETQEESYSIVEENKEALAEDEKVQVKDKKLKNKRTKSKENKENSKEILKRVLTPINKCVNTYKQFRTNPINIDVKDILKNNNINYNNWQHDSQRDYSNHDFTKLYANNFES